MEKHIPNLMLDEANNLLAWALENTITDDELKLKFIEGIVGIQLEKLIDRYDQGESEALIYIIEHCLRFKIEIPDQFCDAFNQCIAKWKSAEAISLDQAFNVERKQFRKDAQRRKLSLLPFVYDAVMELHRDGHSIDEYLFEQVGNQFSIGKTTASKYFYEAKRQNESNEILTKKVMKSRAFNIHRDSEYKKFVLSISKLPRKK